MRVLATLQSVHVGMPESITCARATRGSDVSVTRSVVVASLAHDRMRTSVLTRPRRITAAVYPESR